LWLFSLSIVELRSHGVKREEKENQEGRARAGSVAPVSFIVNFLFSRWLGKGKGREGGGKKQKGEKKGRKGKGFTAFVIVRMLLLFQCNSLRVSGGGKKEKEKRRRWLPRVTVPILSLAERRRLGGEKKRRRGRIGLAILYSVKYQHLILPV